MSICEQTNRHFGLHRQVGDLGSADEVALAPNSERSGDCALWGSVSARNCAAWFRWPSKARRCVNKRRGKPHGRRFTNSHCSRLNCWRLPSNGDRHLRTPDRHQFGMIDRLRRRPQSACDRKRPHLSTLSHDNNLISLHRGKSVDFAAGPTNIQVGFGLRTQSEMDPQIIL